MCLMILLRFSIIHIPDKKAVTLYLYAFLNSIYIMEELKQQFALTDVLMLLE